MATKLRVLRLKYGISLDELAQKGGVSNQQISRLELGEVHGTGHREQLVGTAFAHVIAARKIALTELEREFTACRGCLLVPAEGSAHE